MFVALLRYHSHTQNGGEGEGVHIIHRENQPPAITKYLLFFAYN